ncbi:S26 family signal peptidase, partial [Corynebacterium sp. 122RC1]|nr:S26 family signal peptidase [Corynebacterium sp. 122RC1]
MTGSTDSTDASSEDALDHDSAGDSAANPADEPQSRPDPEQDEKPKRKHGALREGAILVTIAVVLYYVMLTFIARPYLIPSESMEPTL